MKDKKTDKSKQNGFTLVELMIVIAIIGILTALAFPSYQGHLKTSRRADAKSALMGLANAMERHFTENNSYVGAATNGVPVIFSATSPIDGDTVFYNLTVSLTQTTYTLRATPVSGGSQSGNGFLELKHTDSKGRWDRDNSGSLSSSEIGWD